MTAASYDFLNEDGLPLAEQYASFDWSSVYKDSVGDPVPMVDWAAEMDLREEITGDEVFTLTTENGRIALGDADGVIALSITAEDMAFGSDQAKGGASKVTFLYDLVLTRDDGVVIRLLEGKFPVKLGVTR